MLNRPPEPKTPDQGSKYSLVVAVAKRARQIVNRRDPGVVLAHKPVVIALDEIAQGSIRVVERPKDAPESENTPEAAPEVTAVPEEPAPKPEE